MPKHGHAAGCVDRAASLNIAAARALFFYGAELVMGVAPIGIALEIGLLRSIRSHGRVRVFR
jgi:hypothetical protein